jgi:hypothetical protein
VIVKIAWTRKYDTQEMWVNISIWAIEYFGLPGDRYYTRINVEYMEFVFKDRKDALLMALRWNAELLEPTDLESV